jgi:hypothetical protein
MLAQVDAEQTLSILYVNMCMSVYTYVHQLLFTHARTSSGALILLGGEEVQTMFTLPATVFYNTKLRALIEAHL